MYRFLIKFCCSSFLFLFFLGWITNTENFSVGEVQVGMQDFLVCIEMFIAACAHKYAFGSETYADGRSVIY